MTDNRRAPAPQGVRAVMPDGDVIPLDLVCAGLRNGKWRWVSAWPLRQLPVRVEYDHLPADATIQVNSSPAGGG